MFSENIGYVIEFCSNEFIIISMRCILPFFLVCAPLTALEIRVDYRFDTNGFFDDPAARAVMEAAAKRWSRVIDQTLLPVNMTDGEFIDGRFEIIHPSTGEIYVMSAAEGEKTDFNVQGGGLPVADEYLDGFTLEEDVWILFVGARVINEAARGGPIGGGGNLGVVFSDPESFLNRGFNEGAESLAMLGGAISFDLDRNWNFNLANLGSGSALDFYTVALHEIGHGLGLNSRAVAEWRDLINGDRFVGQNVIAVYQEETGVAVSGLKIESPEPRDYHWKTGEYDSKLFPLGTPLYFGTVGPNRPQDLLMEPSFMTGVFDRLEITNIDVAALRDLGWSVISEDPPRGPELPIETGRAADGTLAIKFIAEEGATYTVQTSPDGVSWVNVVPSITGDGNQFCWSDGQEGFSDPFGSTSDLSSKFYRIVKD